MPTETHHTHPIYTYPARTIRVTLNQLVVG